MDLNNYWLNCLSVGKRGEELVKQALAAHCYWIEDVSDNYEYRQKDIDLIVEGTTVEVKNDLKSNYTNNIFVEMQNNNNIKRNGKGWAKYCEANYLAFVQEQKGLAHFIKREELLSIAAKYPLKSSFDTQGYCVPIAAISKLPSYKCMGVEKL